MTRGKLALATLADIDADAAHAALTAVHGIGPWTADIYLLSCLGHADAWPAGDLALQEAARIAFGLKTRPTAKEMIALAEPWRPFRAVAARVLMDLLSHRQRPRRRPCRDQDPPPQTACKKGGEAKSKRTARKRGPNGR